LFRTVQPQQSCRPREQNGFGVINFSYTQSVPFWSVSLLDAMRQFGLVEISAQRPAIHHPLMPLLHAAVAAFDFARARFAPLSQMVFTLGRRADR
jgi:hypothetical protein